MEQYATEFLRGIGYAVLVIGIIGALIWYHRQLNQSK